MGMYVFIWRPPSLSEITPMDFNTWLTHLGSEASIYKENKKLTKKIHHLLFNTSIFYLQLIKKNTKIKSVSLYDLMKYSEQYHKHYLKSLLLKIIYSSRDVCLEIK